jgi:hypothetical protein
MKWLLFAWALERHKVVLPEKAMCIFAFLAN